MKRMLVVLAVLAAFGATAEASPSGADIKAALVRCADVTYPTPLSGCGDDPLMAGRVEIGKNGDVAAALTGAAVAAPGAGLGRRDQRCQCCQDSEYSLHESESSVRVG